MPQSAPPSTSSSSSQMLCRPCYCRWAWCRQTFSTYAELERHVINEHVLTAVPVRRRDLAMLRRAEEGIGESLSLGGFVVPSYGFGDVSPEELHPKQDGTSVEVEPSSLPSPPDTASRSLSRSSPAPASLDQCLSQETPSQELPASRHHPHATSLYTIALHSFSEQSSMPMHQSQSPSGSPDSVEKQLTQGMPMDIDDDSSQMPSNQLLSETPFSATRPSVTNNASAIAPATSIATRGRQAWYGTLPAKRSRKVTTKLMQSMPRQSPTRVPRDSGTHAEFRSGTLQTGDAASSQETSQEDYHFSCGPLQTQARYRSQSLSQTQ